MSPGGYRKHFFSMVDITMTMETRRIVTSFQLSDSAIMWASVLAYFHSLALAALLMAYISDITMNSEFTDGTFHDCSKAEVFFGFGGLRNLNNKQFVAIVNNVKNALSVQMSFYNLMAPHSLPLTDKEPSKDLSSSSGTHQKITEDQASVMIWLTSFASTGEKLGPTTKG